jgi:hypothetical protein
MKLNHKLKGVLTMTAACLAFSTTVEAQVSSDALLDKLVSKGILTQDEAAQLQKEAATNAANNVAAANASGLKFTLSKAIKSVELYGDLRMRFEYRGAKLGPDAGNIYDAESRYRYALRLGIRGDLADDFYYGLRFETSPNERSPWNTFGNATGSQAPYQGPFSKANNYSIYIGEAYLGWRPLPWLDVSFGRVPQPLYTTPMVWDSDFNPEGMVEKVRYSYGPADFFATFGQFIYQDTTPSTDAGVLGGSSSALTGQFSDQGVYLLAWQLGGTYHLDTNMSFKAGPVFYNYIGHGNQGSGFYGAFVGQGVGGFTYGTNGANPSGVPGTGSIIGSTVYGDNSFNQTGINNLAVVEFPAEFNFKLGKLDAKAFGDFALNLQGNDRAQAAYDTGEKVYTYMGTPNPFPHGPQLNNSQAMQFGMAVGNNLGLLYGAHPKKGTWEARAYYQHIEQYALDPNLLDSDFFEGRGNLQGIYTGVAYSFTDAMIASVRYGWAERINDQLGTGGYNADLPLPNPIDHFQVFQMDLTWRW